VGLSLLFGEQFDDAAADDLEAAGQEVSPAGMSLNLAT